MAAKSMSASGMDPLSSANAKQAEKTVVVKNVNVIKGSMGMFDQRFSVVKPNAQKIPETKLSKSPMFSGALVEVPLESNKNNPMNATQIAAILALVRGSDSNSTPRIVAQTGVR